MTDENNEEKSKANEGQQDKQAQGDDHGNPQNNSGNHDDSVRNEQPPSMIEDARKLADELKKQNQIMAENLKKAEKMQVENLMGGRTSAGREPTQDDKVVDYARNILKGSGYEDELFPKGGQ